MARLNTLAGMRLAARGQISQAIDAWVAGVRFSQHLAQGGSVISLLTARVALHSNLQALSQAIATASITEEQRKQIQVALLAIPDTAFNWANAVQLEESGLEIFVQRRPFRSDQRRSSGHRVRSVRRVR